MAKKAAKKGKKSNSGAGEEMMVGPHVSAAGDLANAIANGVEVGASCIQIFTRSQRTWQTRPLEEEEVERFRAAWKDSPITEVMSHDSYLINLGSPEPDKLALSRRAFTEEAERCARLGIRLLNFHPGARMGSDHRECLERIVASVAETMDAVPGPDIVYIIENTAGQGSAVGHTLEDLAFLLEALDSPARTGICLDTCHLFAAGYDLPDEESWERFWENFDRRVGFGYLKAFHLNDAKKPLGSRVDRHENLGEGTMGIAVFRRLAKDPRFFEVPMFLETPGGSEVWTKEIEALRGFRGE